MAFSTRNLSVLAYGNGFTLWHYKAAGDECTLVGRAGYFDDAGDMLAGGDMLMVSNPQGGQMLCVIAEGTGLRAVPMT
jgi:hypothetical protein